MKLQSDFDKYPMVLQEFISIKNQFVHILTNPSIGVPMYDVLKQAHFWASRHEIYFIRRKMTNLSPPT